MSFPAITSRLPLSSRHAPRLCALALATLSLLSVAARAQPGRTIFFNGKVFTSNPAHPWAQGVAVEGRFILAVGSTEHVLSYKAPGSRLVDLQGRAMIPGFNDAHVHPFDTTAFPRAARLNAATDFLPAPGPTLTEVVELVRKGAAANPPGTWLFVSIGTSVVDDPGSTRFTLDAVAPDHPVLLAAWYGHGTFLNTNALRVLGIGEHAPDPFGGFYDRVPGTDVLTGVAHEYAEHLIRRSFAQQMTDAEFIELYERFAATAARNGYTSVQEFSVGVPQPRHLDLVSRSRIPIRWRAICFPLTPDEPCDVPSQLSANKPFGKVTASGIKWIVDGDFVERSAFLTKDYADAPGVRGHLNFPPDAIKAELLRSTSGPADELQPLFHTIGDATSDAILDQMGAVATDAQWRARRPRIEHGTLLRPDRYQNVRSKGAFVVQNPIHLALPAITSVRFPLDLFAVIDPLKSLLDANVSLAIGSDSVVAPGNPFVDLFFAVVHPERPSEALTLEQAVIAYTKTAAEAEFQEQWKGTLEPGKLADLAVLSRDIFEPLAPPTALLETRSILTVVDGEAVFDAGELAAQEAAATP